jgi:hypothetical protein
MDRGLERRVKVEALVREVNNRIREVGETFAAGEEVQLDLLCECGDERCNAVLTVTLEEYEAARLDDRHLLVAPDHAPDARGKVVAVRARFVIVETTGEVGDLLSGLALD